MRCTLSNARTSPSRTSVVVAGCGPIGLGMVAGARAKNPANVIALDMAPDKLELAAGCAAPTSPINIAEHDAVADDQRPDRRLRCRRLPGGHRPPVGGPAGLNLLRELGTLRRVRRLRQRRHRRLVIISDDKELDVLGAHLGPYCWPAAIKMIESGVLPMDKICTHQLPLTEFQKGLDLVASGKESVKVSLIPA